MSSVPKWGNSGMACPSCGSQKVQVKDSRAAIVMEMASVRRRRLCSDCKHVWTTYEIPSQAIDRSHQIARQEILQKLMTDFLGEP